MRLPIAADVGEFRSRLRPNLPLLAMDYGRRRIGLAISSDPKWTIARPLGVVNARQPLSGKRALVRKYRCWLISAAIRADPRAFTRR